ncbi:MAG TPA: hypothetical protein VKB26_03595 [Candidatus Acidoferrales bacterium]|nr:hypothetical protein [Candidatus Acidoferrales bacterium]
MSPALAMDLRWAASSILEFGVFSLAVRRKAFKELPFFSMYLGLLVSSEVARWLAYRVTTIASPVSFGTYWTTEGLLVTFHALVVYEICRLLLRPYKGIWRLCQPFLFTVGAVLIVDAALATRDSHKIANAILAGERGLELAALGILLFGLAFCKYYGVRIERHLLWIGLGLGFYSAVQVANNTFMQHGLGWYFLIWENLRLISFNIATVCWFVAVLKPLPAAQPVPALLNQQEYEVLVPQVTARLRELNTRLLEMWK